ncbi:RagB/SusD family nutrient uptake outer membrane protein [Pedobacter sp. ISL-68]|uniref:RagB/SusD family nutrient uptake outer membrane protein n=1 Tax=unclassified Pedobacter TaxID=2628915 RepID=UPI001BE926D1|nr:MULTISPECIES: RagB/SusD family nutrient uptake outer membrane protein [unclassified Pedobacter]MBT2560204.1 RagB/SusD family nutrient uptake outer membrane protein [Pedobacter sp. ISL-64]MBT2589183.1 RagB/SusD family nutrient uptake outer membrane protein [Pedobacter sp. ISL-68]
MKKRYTIIFLALTIASVGCRKYVEIDQLSTRTLKYTSDYRYIMNNNNVLEGTFSYPILSGDDTEINDPTRQNTLGDILGNVYSWAGKYTTETQNDSDWDRQYKIIYTCNEVLEGVLSSADGADAEKQKIYAEALVHRAYAYLVLVNMYGKQYNSSTAGTDLGVPMLTTSNLYTKLNRAPVAQVYAAILKDLKTSISHLPALPDYNVRPAKVSAYALLAKTYLNMRDFGNASLYADSSLVLQNTLLDLKSYESSTSTMPVRLNNPEVMLSKISNVVYTAISVNNDLLTAMGPTDLRYKLFTDARSRFGTQFSAAFTGRASCKYLINEFVILNGPSVPEMMLIKAECLARAGNTNAAMAQVNNLRIKRFTAANYIPLNASDAGDALRIVIAEKRKEFLGTGIRWFDQKRLNLDVEYAQVKTRSFKSIDYTLQPNSNRYLYPIGDKYILLNPELEQNPR